MIIKKINKTAIVLALFIFLIPGVIHARDCSHCWCYIEEDDRCEHHTNQDDTEGNPLITTDTECNGYCAGRSTEDKTWRALHCDDSWIDWNESSSDPCFGKTTVAPSSAEPTEGAVPAEVPFQPVEPRLAVPDFNVKFSEIGVTKQGGYGVINVPWLAEYIAAVYQYLLGALTLLAVVMIMYGGFRWITAAGDAGKISEAKRTIVSAVVGLAIGLGSYTILNLINPNLVIFKALQLRTVERDVFEFAIDTTTADTTEGLPSVPTPTFTDCPIQLSAAATLDSPTEARTEEFGDKISSVVTATTKRESAIQIAEAAAKCGVHFGSCGKTVKTINKFAGIKGRGIKTHSITDEQMKYLDTINCTKGSSKECYTNAQQTAYNKLFYEVGEGWPNAWTDELQPGDVIIVFNANSGPYGIHAAMFMGWKGNRAQVVQGAWGKYVKEGTICIRSECEDPIPIVRMFKAQ